MKLISQIGKTFSFRNKKLNTFNLILILTIASLIGTLSAILPSLLAGIGPDGESLESREGSNLGYEEIIRVNIDKYGNLSVTGSFQGPQVNPGVDLSLREYDYVWQVGLIATNINTRDYYHHYLVETLEAGGPMYDVYFNVMFFVEDSYFSLLNPDLPVLSDSEMLEAAEILKNDIERAFGIANNFTDFPNLVSDYTGLGRIILYGFNYSPQIDYDYFIQYFADHTPSGLADSFSSTRINNARSWLEWMYSNNWNFTYAIKSSTRSPYGDYDSSVECQVHLLYPQIGYSNWGNYVLNLSQVLDTPFNPLVALNESAFSTSEIDVVVENGNITSSTSSPYHVPQQRGLDHDYWLLLNASYYDTFVEGYGSIPDITVNFWYGLRNLTYILPPASPQQGNVNIQVMEVGANLTNAYGILIAGIYEEAAYDRIFDDLAYGSSRATPLEYVYLFDMGGGLFQGTWQNTYKYPNGNYYIYTFGVYSELSGLTTRDRFSGSPGGQIYEIKLVQLNNPSTIQLDVLNPQPNDVVLKTLNITVNVTSPEPISSVEYYVYNYSALMMGAMPGMEIMNGTLTYGGLYWFDQMDTTQIPSTHAYVLRIKGTDANGTFFTDVPIIVNNTFYQENVPIYAPMGGHAGYGLDLCIGLLEPPLAWDPMMGGTGGGPWPINFFGYGVSFGMDFNDILYQDIIGVFIMADNNHTDNPMWKQIGDLPSLDYGIVLMTYDNSPETLEIAEEIADRAEIAFALPTNLSLVKISPMDMGGGMMVYLITYGGNYSSNKYEDFIDKFHASVPSGLADIYTKANMTQADLYSTLLFGWANPDAPFGQQIFQGNPYMTYNMGEFAYISPTLQFPNYFDDTLSQPRSVSLNDIFPQISQINACAPIISNTIFSGFGSSIFSPAGVNVLNSNITGYYPVDPNVFPIYDTIAPSYLNFIFINMLNTESTPIGLITTDDIRFNFTGPYITNNILSPAEMQTIELSDYNATVTSQCTTGEWMQTLYIITPLTGGNWNQSTLIYNGNNWTGIIPSENYMPGTYQLMTYMQCNNSMWAMNRTYICVNNSISTSGVMITITDWGDVEISNWMSAPFFGYGIDMGLDRSIPEYNSTDLDQIIIWIAQEDSFNMYSDLITGENWNVIIAFFGSIEDKVLEAATPIVADLERVFNITGCLQQVENIFPGQVILPWVMNYDSRHDYDHFLTHYETVINGNISKVYSKENMLKADHSHILYYIMPEYYARQQLEFMMYPKTGNIGDPVQVSPIMQFEDVYEFTALNQQHNFSLANFLGISEINTDYEQGMTFSRSGITTSLFCGNYTNSEVYPNVLGQTFYSPPMYPYMGHTYQFMMENKQGSYLDGIYTTDDIRFNFTAPYTLLQVLSPTDGSTIHGTVNLVVNATMLAPSTTDIMVEIYKGYFPSLAGPYLDSFNLTYDSGNHYWNGTWQTLTSTINNGWYEIVFISYDALGRPYRNVIHIYVENTLYQEGMNIVVDQFGNITASFQMMGNAINIDFNDSISQYDEILLATFMATNSLLGSPNYSKQVLTEWLNFPENDFGLAVMVSADKTEAEALLIATPIKDDYERIFGIEGNLSYLYFGPFFMPMPGFETMNFLFFGNNYTSSLTFNHFVDHFHQSVPPGFNNTITPSTITGTDAFFMWVLFTDPSINPGGTIPTLRITKNSMIQGTLFFPQYYGSNYMGASPTTHDLSLADLFNVPQFAHASGDAADSVISQLSITTENADMTRWYPNIPGMAEKNSMSNAYEALLAMRNPYDQSSGAYQYVDMEIPDDDVNVTFDEPMTRPNVVTPLSGTIIDGPTTVRVLVENSSSATVQNVYFKVYTEAEYDQLGIFSLFQGSMPDSRSPGIYGQYPMNDEGGGYWNCTWLAYQHADGPIWFEVVVETSEGFYSYNSTKVIISNSNPLDINVLSPSNEASVSGMMEVSAQVINSTPIDEVNCVIYTASPLNPLTTITLTPRGGGIYAGYYGTHGLKNGTYHLLISVSDIYGAIGYKDSVMITVSNPILLEITLLHPTSTLEWSTTAQIAAAGTSPYNVKGIYYRIYQQIYYSGWNYWATWSLMTEGMMVDPDSTWVATIDTSSWPTRVYDGMDWYEAYYLIELSGMDTGYAETQYSARFQLGSPAVIAAEIISPGEYDMVSGICNVMVATLGNETFTSINGRVLTYFGYNEIQELTFTYNDTFAVAPIYTYAYPNDYYFIEVWGATSGSGFYDGVQVEFNNPTIFTINCISPAPLETVTGNITVQLDITNVTALGYVWVDIVEPYGPWYVRLESFTFNGTSGYWEQLWDTSELFDGTFQVFCGAKDSNNAEVYYEHLFTIDNPPRVTILEPAPASNYTEYENIHFVVQIPDTDVDYVELWAEGNYIMDFTQAEQNWTADWSDTIGYAGAVFIQVFAYDIAGHVNDTEWIGISLSKFVPPAGRADVYNATTTDDNGTAQTIFTEGETVEYHATIRGDTGNSTYVITAQTDDPLLQGYLKYTESVTVMAGEDFEIVFNYTIAVGAPTGTYTVQILVWTDWPWDGGICVDFITITFEVV